MRLPDPWDHRPPKIEELSRQELIEFLDTAHAGELPDWDVGFCQSLSDSLKYKATISRKQYGVVVRLLPRLWDNDPELWRPVDGYDYEPDPDPDRVATIEEAAGADDYQGDCGEAPHDF